MKNFLRFLLIPALLIIAAAPAFATKEDGYKSLNISQLQELLIKHKNAMLIDSRGKKYIEGNEVIKGASVLPADQTTKVTLAKLVKDKETPLVFYCSNTQCGASAAAAYIAHEAGYKNVYKFPGGFAEWKEKGLPTAKLN